MRSKVVMDFIPTPIVSTNRGGRPHNWTVPRTRRYVRIRQTTDLPTQSCLGLVEEPGFKPGVDAANKITNSVLGYDPRWSRAKNEDQVRCRYFSLQYLFPGRRSKQKNNSKNRDGTDASVTGTTATPSSGSSTTRDENPPKRRRLSAWFRVPGASSRAPAQPSGMQFFPDVGIPRDASRQDSGLTSSTDISIPGDVRQKLASVSPRKMKRAYKILKHNSNRSAPRPAQDLPRQLQPRHGDTCDAFDASYAVPGDFLNNEAFQYMLECVGPSKSNSHALDRCWCKVAQNVFPLRGVWDSLKMPYEMSKPELSVRDGFGNTAFHYLAAKDGIQEAFIHLVYLASDAGFPPLRYLNTASQNFLHVLHPSWFLEGARLCELLGILQGANFDLFATDVYGRNFYHVFRAKTKGSRRLPSRPTDDKYHLQRRDAFGVKPDDEWPAWHGDGQAGLAPPGDDPVAHTALLRTVTNAIAVDRFLSPKPYGYSPNPREEDSEGRNGLHCLAEVNLGLHEGPLRQAVRSLATRAPKVEPGTRPQGYLKRPHDAVERAETPRLRETSSKRVEFLRGLLRAGVDPDHYDKRGNTPLMAFVANSKGDTKQDQSEIQLVIKTLILDFHANLESRNRNGETALHVAARCGKIHALKALLDFGANPYARNAEGVSVLGVLDKLFLATGNDPKSNGRYLTCRHLISDLAANAKPAQGLLADRVIRKELAILKEPTVVNEWATRPSIRP